MVDALRVSGMRAGYGETVVLEDVAFGLPERGSLAVLGRNGVGKTTLLATLMGNTTFHSGSIEYRGRPIERLPAYEQPSFVPSNRFRPPEVNNLVCSAGSAGSQSSSGRSGIQTPGAFLRSRATTRSTLGGSL